MCKLQEDFWFITPSLSEISIFFCHWRLHMKWAAYDKRRDIFHNHIMKISPNNSRDFRLFWEPLRVNFCEHLWFFCNFIQHTLRTPRRINQEVHLVSHITELLHDTKDFCIPGIFKVWDSFFQRDLIKEKARKSPFQIRNGVSSFFHVE